ESRSVASLGALYAIGRGMELLLLTVCNDVSILPPLLKLSRSSNRTNLRITCRTRVAAECPRAHESLEHEPCPPTILTVPHADPGCDRVPEAEPPVAESRRGRRQGARNRIHQRSSDGF